MPDMEKVTKGLECHKIDNNHRINCADCPYYVDDDNYIRCVNDLHDNALAMLNEQKEEIENLKQTAQSMMEGICLLKEHEAVEPTWQQGKAYCGACGKRIPLKIKSKFCHKCGKPILWEGQRWMGVSILEMPTSEKERKWNKSLKC